MNHDQVLKIPLDQIAPSPFNTERSRRYETTELASLGKNMREHGQIEPAIVREKVGAKGEKYELAAGERRWRGASAEGLETLDCIVRVMDDRAVCGVLLSENLQRSQPSPLEEADTFADLLAAKDELGEPIYPTRKALADAIQKTEDDIANRLAMRNAPAQLLEALAKGRIKSAMICSEVGRMIDEESRKKAAKMILEPDDSDEPLGYVAAKRLIREQFMISLSGCGFDATDPKLVPEKKNDSGDVVFGGPCEKCPCLSANKKDLAGELAAPTGKDGGRGRTAGIAPNLCTNPGCFRKKQANAWEAQKKEALAKGQKVIEGDAAKRVFNGWQGEIGYDSPYADLSGKPGYGDVGQAAHSGKLPNWGKLIEGSDVEIVLARNPVTNKTHKLINRKQAVAAIKKHSEEEGGKNPFAVAKRPASEEEKKSRAAQNLRAKVSTALSYEAARELAKLIGEKGLGLEGLDIMFKIALNHAGADGQQFLGKMLDLEKSKADNGRGASGRDYGPAVEAWFKANATTANQKLGYIVLALEARGMRWRGVKTDMDFGAGEFLEDEFEETAIEHLMKHYKIDLEAMEKRIKAEMAAPKPKPAAKGSMAKSKLTTVTRSQSAARNQAVLGSVQDSEIHRKEPTSDDKPTDSIAPLLKVKAAGDKKKKGKLPKESRAAIVAAQKKRWAKIKKGKAAKK